MAELIAGQSMVLTWVYSGGTINLAGDYRTCEWNPSTAYEDVTAGADTQIGRLPTLNDATANITLVQQTGGTALNEALKPQTAGTLTIQPEGTASNKRVITLPAYCDGAQYTHPYANVSIVTVAFSGSSTLNNYTDSQNA